MGAEAIVADGAGEFTANGVGAHILPDDGVGVRGAGVAIPDDGGFALVGNADGGDIGTAEIGAGKSFADDLLGTLPDFLGVVLNPAWLGVDLGVLVLGHGDDLAGLIKNHTAGAGSALVYGEDIA